MVRWLGRAAGPPAIPGSRMIGLGHHPASDADAVQARDLDLTGLSLPIAGQLPNDVPGPARPAASARRNPSRPCTWNRTWRRRAWWPRTRASCRIAPGWLGSNAGAEPQTTYDYCPAPRQLADRHLVHDAEVGQRPSGCAEAAAPGTGSMVERARVAREPVRSRAMAGRHPGRGVSSTSIAQRSAIPAGRLTMPRSAPTRCRCARRHWGGSSGSWLGRPITSIGSRSRSSGGPCRRRRSRTRRSTGNA